MQVIIMNECNRHAQRFVSSISGAWKAERNPKILLLQGAAYIQATYTAAPKPFRAIKTFATFIPYIRNHETIS